MENANSFIAVIPCSKFKWTAQIQLKEALFTRDQAIRYASDHGCNLIVKYEKRSGPLFDVLHDPNAVYTSGDGCETIETVETVAVLAKPEPTGWNGLVLRAVAGIAKRLGSAASTSHREKAVPAVHSPALEAK
ncbi:MAG TPA: hypothetical protein VMW51_09905 [Terriglobia bacterium]|nr:hypothetical protein [Terriglobia bacterium]